MKTEKVNIVKNEYFRLELELKEEKIKYIGQIEMLKEKLKDYQKIEEEID